MKILIIKMIKPLIKVATEMKVMVSEKGLFSLFCSPLEWKPGPPIDPIG